MSNHQGPSPGPMAESNQGASVLSLPSQLVKDSISSDNDQLIGHWPVSLGANHDQCKATGCACQKSSSDSGQQSCTIHGVHCSVTHNGPEGFANVPDPQNTSTSTQSVSRPDGSLTMVNTVVPVPDFANPAVEAVAKPPPKIGTRFSRESTKFLNRWLSNHENYPYPSREDMKTLQMQTGLDKVQIQNWLANTRRRQKKQGGSKDQSPYIYPRSSSDPVDAPIRPGTPAVRNNDQYRNMNPLQRWVESPPEREPAEVKDIARAVANSPPRPSDEKDLGYYDDNVSNSRNDSSASSHGTSSGSSLGSANSRSSGSSLGGLAPFARNRRRAKRARRRTQVRSLAPIRQQRYQCTFCTETFPTKHDWQRHEKSLHIPLERWECSPNGPRERNTTSGEMHCSFCGEVNPSGLHISNHQPDACQERAFNRKDYLRQHLRLVHKSKLIPWIADIWKTPTPEVRSRCGFCGENLTSWDERVEHLAEHFKLGLTMAEWTGDWGFDDAIVNTLENSIPPYLIHNERTSPYPFEASNQSPESPRSAYELLTLELSYFVGNYQFQHGQAPDNATMLIEACRIIFASEIMSDEVEPGSYPSWLRDLIMSDHDITIQAQVMPIRTPSEGRLRTLKLRGKRNLFEGCPLESQLQTFISNLRESGYQNISDLELREEACQIMKRMDDSQIEDSSSVFSWLVNQIHTLGTWLSDFRIRAGLPNSSILANPLTSDIGCVSDEIFSFDLTTLESSHQIVHKLGSMQDRPEVAFSLTSHGRSYPSTFTSLPPSSASRLTVGDYPSIDQPSSSNFSNTDDDLLQAQGLGPVENEVYHRPDWLKNGNYILNDPNFHRWLGLELQRWVSIISSPQYPNPRIPSDQEIQDQARWLLYNDNDSWNQTAADNPEWLMRFKRDAGIG